jgi:hypothetical protein
LPSIRSISRARPNSQRGYALIAAIVLTVLYFGLVELMLLDSSRELGEARRFRARIIAQTLAENGAELAAVQLALPERTAASAHAEDWQGEITGEMHKFEEGRFEIKGSGTTKGLTPIQAQVQIYGRVVGSEVRIQYTVHTP